MATENTMTNTPSDAELQEIVSLSEKSYHDMTVAGLGRLNVLTRLHVQFLAQAELARRAKPEGVPAELVRQWWSEAVKLYDSHDYEPEHDQYIADKSAAYGREQAQSGVMISHDAWAELVARHPETMQVLFGGQP